MSGYHHKRICEHSNRLLMSILLSNPSAPNALGGRRLHGHENVIPIVAVTAKLLSNNQANSYNRH